MSLTSEGHPLERLRILRDLFLFFFLTLFFFEILPYVDVRLYGIIQGGVSLTQWH